jgi:hypothetical protein
LKDVCITPYLSFEFLIDAHRLKIMKTTIYVLFDMKGAMPNENETKRFGFKNNLKYHWNVRKMVVLNFMEMGCLNKKKNHKKEFGWKICHQIQGIFNMECMEVFEAVFL